MRKKGTQVRKKSTQKIRSANNAEQNEIYRKNSADSAENSAADPQYSAPVLKSQWEKLVLIMPAEIAHKQALPHERLTFLKVFA
ncbi:hypothetical protein ABK905_00480 [Acerihabitans sp. KWT182]|uniref:Uncharacterized protein n=1 Tax=Acerihabitans sp. KWT182 TaxID=3157919 RepID=A0AAU7QA00_9GAMM